MLRGKAFGLVVFLGMLVSACGGVPGSTSAARVRGRSSPSRPEATVPAASTTSLYGWARLHLPRGWSIVSRGLEGTSRDTVHFILGSFPGSLPPLKPGEQRNVTAVWPNPTVSPFAGDVSRAPVPQVTLIWPNYGWTQGPPAVPHLVPPHWKGGYGDPAPGMPAWPRAVPTYWSEINPATGDAYARDNRVLGVADGWV